jgi:hypothetical protein
VSAGIALSDAPSCAATLCAGYEELRREAIERGPGERPAGRGLALFLARGMVAWMQVLLPIAPVAAGTASDFPAQRKGVPDGLRAELTRLLVSILLERKEG